MRQTNMILLGIAFLLAGESVLLGDTVFTSDGSKLVGAVQRMANGKLILKSEVFGEIEIDASKIVALDTDGSLTLQFESGDRLVGTVDANADGTASAIKTQLGEVPFSASKMTAIWPVGEESPEVIAIRAKGKAEAEALQPKWSATLEAGATLKEGNTDTLDARGRLDVKRKTKDDLLEFFLAADYSEQNDSRTRNEYRGGVNFEAFVTEKRYWYTRLELEFDEFEALDLRSTVAVGLGHYWIREDDQVLKGRIGLGYRHESYNNGRIEKNAVIDLGFDARTVLSEWAEFTHSTTYSPAFEEFNDYRLDLDTALVFPFKSDAVKLKVGIRNEYNSTPQPGFERLDNTYYANIQFDLTK